MFHKIICAYFLFQFVIIFGHIFDISSAIRCHQTVETEYWEQEEMEGECPSAESTHCFKAFCEYSYSMPESVQEPGFYIRGCATNDACKTPKSRFWMNLCSNFKDTWSDENWRRVYPCFLCDNTDLCNANATQIVAPKLLILYNILLILTYYLLVFY